MRVQRYNCTNFINVPRSIYNIYFFTVFRLKKSIKVVDSHAAPVFSTLGVVVLAAINYKYPSLHSPDREEYQYCW